MYSVARQLRKGTNRKEVEAKLGEPIDLKSVDDAKAEIAALMEQRLRTLDKAQQKTMDSRSKALMRLLDELVQRQKAERKALVAHHAQRT